MTTESTSVSLETITPVGRDSVEPSTPRSLAIFAPSNFELSQRMATALSKSTLIPANFQNNLPNCLIALEMANRMGASPMMVMQNLYIVHGKPAWSSQFVIAAINSTGRFSPLRFEMTGEGDKRQCIAWAVELGTKERLEGPPVSIAMAKAEGWFGKNGSKWQTMPELMLRYRAGTFFGRLYAPEVLMGMRDDSEIIDVEATATPVIERAVIPAAVEPPAAKTEEPKPRARKTPKPEPVSPMAAESAAPADSNAAKIEAKLKESDFSIDDFVKLAKREAWCDTTATTLADIEDNKLAYFLENWSDTLAELQAARDAAKA